MYYFKLGLVDFYVTEEMLEKMYQFVFFSFRTVWLASDHILADSANNYNAQLNYLSRR